MLHETKWVESLNFSFEFRTNEARACSSAYGRVALVWTHSETMASAVTWV